MATHQGASDPTQATERSIWIYRNPDKTELGFPMPGDLTQYIKADIFAKESAERQAADYFADHFAGFGPKQSRNLLQSLGLARYEVPIDSSSSG